LGGVGVSFIVQYHLFVVRRTVNVCLSQHVRLAQYFRTTGSLLGCCFNACACCRFNSIQTAQSVIETRAKLIEQLQDMVFARQEEALGEAIEVLEAAAAQPLELSGARSDDESYASSSDASAGAVAPSGGGGEGGGGGGGEGGGQQGKLDNISPLDCGVCGNHGAVFCGKCSVKR
jgi:uncharacterized membrane protein YgcG